MSDKVLQRLKEEFGDAILETSGYRGDDTAVVARERILDVMTFLRNAPDLRFDQPLDVTAVDWLATGREPRYDVVYHLRSSSLGHRIRIKCPVGGDEPAVASVYPVYPGLRWFERECWDMFGIKFAGHPDLRRMFLYEQFVGHPLRKDYPKERRQPLVRREGVD